MTNDIENKTSGMDKILSDAHSLWDIGNETRAFALFLQAAKEKKIEAYNNLGYMLDHGIGVKKDKISAFGWYKKAARAGDIVSFNNVALCYIEQGKYLLARKWLLKSIDNRHHWSTIRLSLLYLHQFNNIKLAIKYAEIAMTSKYVSDHDREEAKCILLEIDELRK